MTNPLLTLVVAAQVAACTRRPRSRPSDAGQATAEYALVLLGVAAVALLVVAWATKTNKIGHLLDAVLDKILSNVT